jgi:hypothetical protein
MSTNHPFLCLKFFTREPAMPNWNESEYTKRAGEIASQHVNSKKALNELCEKVARDENMNPNEIRTLVRLANVATFQEIFKRKDDGDKMVEFDTGDPEKVINNLVSSAGQAGQTANIHNDKLASEIPDQMREVRQGFKYEVHVEKMASEDAPEKPGRTDIVILNLEKLANEFEIERRIYGQCWEDQLNKLALEFKKVQPRSPSEMFEAFEKDALATYGEDAVPELAYLGSLLRRSVTVPAPEKLAMLQERHLVEDNKFNTLLKTAYDARQEFIRFENGLGWIQKNTPKLEG